MSKMHSLPVRDPSWPQPGNALSVLNLSWPRPGKATCDLLSWSRPKTYDLRSSSVHDHDESRRSSLREPAKSRRISRHEPYEGRRSSRRESHLNTRRRSRYELRCDSQTLSGYDPPELLEFPKFVPQASRVKPKRLRQPSYDRLNRYRIEPNVEPIPLTWKNPATLTREEKCEKRTMHEFVVREVAPPGTAKIEIT